MTDLLIGGGFALGAGALAWVWRGRRVRSLMIERLALPVVDLDEEESEREQLDAVLPRYRWVAPLVALAVVAGLVLLLDVPVVLAVSLSIVVLILGVIVEGQRHEKSVLKMETQLADSIDLIVGSLGAGAGTMDSLETAAREARPPLGRILREVVGRIRLGDAPHFVLAELADRVPLETFRLFSFTLSVHEETGGSLAPTLSTVGRTIRDRLELKRRIHSEATQAQASVIGILLITYAISLVTWRTNPERMEAFVGSEVGVQFIAGAIVLQAVGLLWMTRLIKIKY